MMHHIIDFCSFIESLSAKVHSAPPSVEKLSDLFQDFYVRAGLQIGTHISAVASRLYRERSPAPSKSSQSSITSGTRSLLSRPSDQSLKDLDRTSRDQQMLTPAEVSERKHQRRLLEYKRGALEEAVERRVCEAIYDKIWRHRSTVDEIRDQKLHSKTAALALVGIGFSELGIDLGESTQEASDKASEMLVGARMSLSSMNESRYPLGKLRHLALAHKAIVDTLSALHPSTSSADEILPTLIYTLISSADEEVNAISNLLFIQRFRAVDKVDGHAAYCLTNLEAAISFLETVDLSSLREDEKPGGPPKSNSRASSPAFDKTDSWNPSQAVSAPTESQPTVSSPTVGSSLSKPPSSLQPSSPAAFQNSTSPATSGHQRRLSNLLQPPSKAFEAANNSIRSTVDESLNNISNTLDNSFKFLFGRLKEEQGQREGEDVVPKTLEDARKLVTPASTSDETATLSESRALAEFQASSEKQDDKFLSLIGGRAPDRERSVDSIQSNGSRTSVPFAAKAGSVKEDNSVSPASRPSAATPPLQGPNAAIESMKTLGNTLNPLKGFSGINVMRGFGARTSSGTIPTLSASTEGLKSSENAPSGAASPAPLIGSRLAKVNPPIARFLDVQDPGDLKLSDVGELLKDYHRLAGALKDLGAV